jgi:glycosyltransferase involved in cell wall biosynthesis
MHTAHNVAYDMIDSELNVCVDSDDYLPDGALKKILDFWRANAKPNWAGIIGMDSYSDGGIVGTPFPAAMVQCKYYELKSKFGVTGDKKFVYRTDVIKQYPPYPVFDGEKFVPLGYKYLLIDQSYDLGVIHDVLCVVEYMDDGSTKNIFRQYVINPRGFSYERLVRMRLSRTMRERFQNAVHYVSCSIFLRNSRFLLESSNFFMTVLAIPLGVALNIYIRLSVAQRGRGVS